MALKNCTKCGEPKILSNFHTDKQKKDALLSICKSCKSIESKAIGRTKKGLIRTIYSHQRLRCRRIKAEPPMYDLSQLKKWFYEQPNFSSLFNNWINSGYSKWHRPSCDRLDDYKGYTLSNIRLVTWKENFEKYLEDKKNGINNKNSKPVNQLSLESKLIQKFSSQVEASRITGINKNCISQCCLRNIKTSGGYIWRYSI